MSYKITIERDDWKEPVILHYERLDITQEFGHVKAFDGYHPVGISPNGQERIMIRAWSGCETYDSFFSSE